MYLQTSKMYQNHENIKLFLTVRLFLLVKYFPPIDSLSLFYFGVVNVEVILGKGSRIFLVARPLIGRGVRAWPLSYEGISY